jgi:syntaxin-binding protein 5
MLSTSLKRFPFSHNSIDVIQHPRNLNLVFVIYTGGIILSDLVRSCNSFGSFIQRASQTLRNTVRAYEFVLPPGAPGGAGYDHPVGFT